MNDIWDASPPIRNLRNRTEHLVQLRKLLPGILVVLFTVLVSAGCIGLGALDRNADIGNLTSLDMLNTYQACEVWTQDPDMVLAQLDIEQTYANVSAVADYCSRVNGDKW